LIFITLEAAEEFGAGCYSVERIGTCLVAGIVPIEIRSRGVTRPVAKVSVPTLSSNIREEAFCGISASLVVEEGLVFSSAFVTTKISVS